MTSNHDKTEAEGETPRPNILCFVMDQLRWDHLGCYGNPRIKTPNLDRLAARGVTFDRAYVANPLCMPARATLFTGLTPRAHGVRTNGIPLDPSVPTMTEALRRSGYRTHSVGKIHLAPFGLPPSLRQDPARNAECYAGWDGREHRLPSPYYGLESAVFVGGHGTGVFGEYIDWLRKHRPDQLDAAAGREVVEDLTLSCGGEHALRSALPAELHYNHFIADKTIEFLDGRQKEKRPFFCWCSFPDPHHPYVAPQPYCDMYDPRDVPLPDRREGELDDLPPFYRIAHEEGPDERWGGFSGRRKATAQIDDDAWRRIVAMTWGMVSHVDKQIGRVMEALEANGLAENTIVVFLADHGDMMGDHWMANKGPFHFEGLLRMPLIWSCPGRFPESVRTPGLASQLDFAPTILDLCGAAMPEGETPEEPVAKCQLPALPGRSLAPVLFGQEKKVRDWVIVENDEDYLGTRVRTFLTNRYKLTLYSGHEDWGEIFDLQEDPRELHNLWRRPEAKGLKQALIAKFMHCYLEEEPAAPRRLSHA